MAVGRQLGNQLEGDELPRLLLGDLRAFRCPRPDSRHTQTSTVVCGPHHPTPGQRDTIVVNPRVVVEVTSDSTEHYDRGSKLEHFQKIPSLDAVVLVSHRESLVEVWTRTASGWTRAASSPGERATIAPLRRA